MGKGRPPRRTVRKLACRCAARGSVARRRRADGPAEAAGERRSLPPPRAAGPDPASGGHRGGSGPTRGAGGRPSAPREGPGWGASRRPRTLPGGAAPVNRPGPALTRGPEPWPPPPPSGRAPALPARVS